MSHRSVIVTLCGAGLPVLAALGGDPCADCHQKVNPSIVADWQASEHEKFDVGYCHNMGGV